MAISKKISKWITWFLVSLLFILVSVILVGRYYISPRIDQWRPQLVDWLQKNVHPQFNIEQISVDWHYLTPNVHFQKVGLGNNGELAQVETLVLEVDGLSLLQMRPQVKKILVNDAKVVIERNTQGEVLLGGKVLSTQDDTLKAPSIRPEELTATLLPWLDWGFERMPHDIEVKNGHIVWRDSYQESRPDLSFSPVNLQAKHDKQSLELNLNVSIAEVASSAMTVNTRLSRSGSGEVNIAWKNWQPQHLKKWLHFPLFMKAGVIEAANISLSFENVDIKNFSTHWVLNHFQFLEKDDESNGLLLQGDKVSIAISSENGLNYPYYFDISTDKLHVQAQDFFRHPMDFEQVQMQGQYRLNEYEKTHLNFDLFKAQLPYGALEVKGSWDAHPESRNGFIQLDGSIARMELNKLAHYLPKAISVESLNWLEKAFIRGTLENAKVHVRGNVDHIPFGRHSESGNFQIKGPVKDVGLHYHQFPAKGNTYWPDVFVPSAEVDFNRDTIAIKGDSLQLDEKYDLSSIQASQAEVYIRSIEKNTVVELHSKIKATGESFLKFYHQSPLRPILSQALDHSQMSGQLEGRLAIHIPILNSDATVVRSDFNVQGASFQFTPDHPKLTQVSGLLKITEKNVQLENTQGSLLGGQTKLSGNIGSKGDRLLIEGNLTAKGLYEFLPLPGIRERIKGSTRYTAIFDFLGDNHINVDIQSQLKGLSISLPQGLSKGSEQVAPLKVTLKAPQSGRDEQLHIDYKNQWLQVLLERTNRRKPQFNRGVIAVNTQAVLPRDDMKLSLHSGDWDVMEWLNFVDEFSLPKKSTSNTSLFPSMRHLDIMVDRLSLFGAYIDKLTLIGERIREDWRLNVNSPDAKGQAVLSMSKQQLDKIHLALSQLRLQFLTSEKNNTHIPQRIDLPTIEGEIEQLSLQDKVLGKVRIDSQKVSTDKWQLKQFSLSNSVGSFYATGALQSDTQMTSADIKMNANALNFGELLAYLGYGDLLKAGKGQANLSLHTQDISSISLNGLSIKGDMQLDNGALLKVNSTAMKALALISLQSLSNLSNLGNSTPSAFSKGLAFDYLRSNFELKDQTLFIEDFRLNGPLIAIVASGNAHLLSKNLDFQAVAIPKIEMSGAAVLTGVIVNPVVGLGAFLSQWLLSEPLNRALTAYFSVKGTWDSPLINDKPLPSEAELKEKRKQQEINNLYRN